MGAQQVVEQFSLPDDTEESLVGTDWHQRAIVNVYDALLDLAVLTGAPWHVGNQLTLVGWAPDGSAWRPIPDIMVHPDAGPAPRKEMGVRDDGVPALVIEVASETTWHNDVNVVSGKAAGYLALGVRQYLVFDPTGAYLDAPCRGWQRAGVATSDWQPDANGRYHSDALDVSFRPEGAFLRVYGPDGHPVASREERLQEIATLRAEVEQLRRRVDQAASSSARHNDEQDAPPA